jgi:hypothetical protein
MTVSDRIDKEHPTFLENDARSPISERHRTKLGNEMSTAASTRHWDDAYEALAMFE